MEQNKGGIQLSQGEGINPSLYNELKDAFDLFDVNGDGHISGRELGMVLRALGQNPTDEMVEEVLKKADKDGDQVITYDEYIALLDGNLKDPAVVEIELREAFRIFDKNRDNTLNLQELRHVLLHCGNPMTPKEVEECFENIDVNKDGVVNIEEFVQYMCKRY